MLLNLHEGRGLAVVSEGWSSLHSKGVVDVQDPADADTASWREGEHSAPVGSCITTPESSLIV